MRRRAAAGEGDRGPARAWLPGATWRRVEVVVLCCLVCLELWLAKQQMLLWASARGLATCSGVLAWCGADPFEGLSNGTSPVIYALRRQDLRLLRAMLGDASPQLAGERLVTAAILADDEQALLGAAQMGYADPARTEGLSLALRQGCGAAVIDVLLSCGADPDGRIWVGDIRPLHLALMVGRPDWVRVLLRHGADPNLITEEGLAPLVLARDWLGPGMEQELVDAGAVRWPESRPGMVLIGARD